MPDAAGGGGTTVAAQSTHAAAGNRRRCAVAADATHPAVARVGNVDGAIACQRDVAWPVEVGLIGGTAIAGETADAGPGGGINRAAKDEAAEAAGLPVGGQHTALPGGC